MKRFSKCLLIGLLGSMCLAVFNSEADLEVSASVQIHATVDFHAPLTPYGTWIEVGSYGRCWHPARVAVDWQPYGCGRWIWTDCGWYWVSDEPWAWACYHYGSWVYESDYGWLWVPGLEWAPAWVSWRFGGGYCGWAPLAPRGVVVGLPSFVFVEAARFHDPVKPSTLIVNKTMVINKTTVVGRSKRETRSLGGGAPQKVVINEGPGTDMIRDATGKNVTMVPIRQAVRQTPVPSVAMREMNASRQKDKAPAAPALTSPAAPEADRRDSPRPAPGARPSHNGAEPRRSSYGQRSHWWQPPNAPEKQSKPGKASDKDNHDGKERH